MSVRAKREGEEERNEARERCSETAAEDDGTPNCTNSRQVAETWVPLRQAPGDRTQSTDAEKFTNNKQKFDKQSSHNSEKSEIFAHLVESKSKFSILFNEIKVRLCQMLIVYLALILSMHAA